jgi:hypothetical protein
MGVPVKRSILLVLAFSTLSSAVRAQAPAQLDATSIDDWRTVNLGSGVSVDVPRAVGDAYRPTDKTDHALMLFRADVKDGGGIYCSLDKLLYNRPPLGMNRQRAIDYLTNAAKDVFCRDAGINGRPKVIEEAESSQGYPGSRCVASFYQVQGDKADGDVIQARVVVAPDAVYALSCIVHDQDQARAETDWDTIWRARITHMEDSLKLPALK